MGTWIPLEKQSPKDFERVLIWWHDTKAGVGGYGFGYQVEDIWHGDAGHYGRKVLAWMHLPPKYDGGVQHECKEHS